MFRNIAAGIVFGMLASSVEAAELVQLNEANWPTHAPHGKEVDAIYGDYALVSDTVVAVVANPIAGRNANLKYREVGGVLLDLTTPGESGGDLLHVLYPATQRLDHARQKYPFRKATIETAKGETVSLVCEAQTGVKHLELRVRYVLTDGKPLRIETTWVNRSRAPVKLSPSDELHYSSLARLPRGASGAAVFESDSWWQGYALVPVDTDWVALGGGKIPRNIVPYGEADSKPSETVVPAGGEVTLARWVIVGSDGLAVQEEAGKLRGVPMRRVSVNATDSAGPAEGAVIRLKRGDGVYGSRRIVDGEATIALPEGAFTIEATGVGRTDKSSKIAATGQPKIKFEMDRPGYVAAKITDATGQPTPCKVQFIGVDGTESPRWFSRTGERRVRNCYQSHNGAFTTEIAPGDYRVIISYGPEHNAIFKKIKVARGKTTTISEKIERAFVQNNWISTDFHAHSSPSGDNDASQLGRVLSILIEDLDYVPCTEHQRIDSYVPHLKRLGAEAFLATSTGMELTGNPLPANHQNAFPLVHKPHTQDGGGPRIDNNSVVQISRLALWDDGSEKLVQQNHPRLPLIAGDSGVPSGPRAAMLPHMDAIEVHPIENILKPIALDAKTKRDTGANRIASWIELINRGVYIPGVVNTDAHYNFHGMGYLRNWLPIEAKSRAAIDTLDVVHAVEKGRVVMSTGPLMEVGVARGDKVATMGQSLAAQDGKIEVRVKVYCPNWFDINRVFVLVNGERDVDLDVTRKSSPDLFKKGGLRFEGVLSKTLKADAHLIVVAVGEGLTLGEVMGPDRGKLPPIAVSNPIFIDVDGGGFRAIRAPEQAKKD